MKIYIGTDHAGFEHKEKLVSFLKELEHEVEDKGAYELDEQDDYPDFIYPVARAVSESAGTARGIILGGSGQGEAMLANKIMGVRAAVFYGEKKILEGSEELGVVELSRAHNDSNILSIGARFITEDEMKDAVKKWLDTPFSGKERHGRRIEKIKRAEENE